MAERYFPADGERRDSQTSAIVLAAMVLALAVANRIMTFGE